MLRSSWEYWTVNTELQLWIETDSETLQIWLFTNLSFNSEYQLENLMALKTCCSLEPLTDNFRESSKTLMSFLTSFWTKLASPKFLMLMINALPRIFSDILAIDTEIDTRLVHQWRHTNSDFFCSPLSVPEISINTFYKVCCKILT